MARFCIFHDNPIEGAARPHLASELVASLTQTFVRGDIRHPDHQTLHLADWMRVVRNAEIVERRWPGLEWID